MSLTIAFARSASTFCRLPSSMAFTRPSVRGGPDESAMSWCSLCDLPPSLPYRKMHQEKVAKKPQTFVGCASLAWVFHGEDGIDGMRCVGQAVDVEEDDCEAGDNSSGGCCGSVVWVCVNSSSECGGAGHW